MNNDLLPPWLNLLLDDVETSLCLPILIVIVLCTLQFILNHIIDIGYTFYQNFKQNSDEEPEEIDQNRGSDLIDKFKGMIYNLAFGSSNTTDSKTSENVLRPKMPRSETQKEEWDYCDDDDD